MVNNVTIYENSYEDKLFMHVDIIKFTIGKVNLNLKMFTQCWEDQHVSSIFDN